MIRRLYDWWRIRRFRKVEDTRLFGWMSIDTAAWYDPKDWQR